MGKVLIRRIEADLGEVCWVLYWQGQWSKPIAILSEMDITRLMREIKEQEKEAEDSRA